MRRTGRSECQKLARLSPTAPALPTKRGGRTAAGYQFAAARGGHVPLGNQTSGAAEGFHLKNVASQARMPAELPEAASAARRKIREAFARHGVAIEGHVGRFHIVANC